MKKLDLKKELKAFYQPPSKKVVAIEIPEFKFLMIDGGIESGYGPSNSPRFQEDVEAIYGAAYTLKFTLKKREANPIDYPVMALQGLWDIRDGVFDITAQDNWDYTLMILVPDLITKGDFQGALDQLRERKGELPAFGRLRLDTFEEGLCVQAMHIGPYATEPETLDRMQQFMEEHGYQDLVGQGGKHHEIYLGDPRRAAPEKLRTLLRHPVSA